MKIVITTMDNLPEYCWNCPCCSSVGRCRADEERRKTSEYRPYWCPLREEKEEATPEESVHPGLIYSVPLHIEELITLNEVQEEEEKVSIAQCNRCGKIVKRNLTTIVKIIHGGTSTVNYPHNGRFRICKDCERWLLDELAYNKKEEQK